MGTLAKKIYALVVGLAETEFDFVNAESLAHGSVESVIVWID